MIGYIIGAVPMLVDVSDYPAVGDVEKNVVYDHGAKTGTFKVPAEGEVENAVGYGKDGTEYTGTATYTVNFIKEAIGELEKEDNMVGELQDG